MFFHILLALLVTSATVTAAEGPLRISMKSTPPRAGAPLAVEATMNWRGPGLLEGTLEFDLEKSAGFIHRTQAIVLTPGQRTLPLLLPPPPATAALLDAVVRFRATGGVHELGEHSLGLWPLRHAFRIAVCDPSRRARGRDDVLLRSIDPTNYIGDGNPDLNFGTTITRVESEFAPSQPLGWCAFDMVVVTADGLGALRERQLDALAGWVEAGGSVLVFPERVDEKSLAFLNRLASARGSPFVPVDGVLRKSNDVPVEHYSDFGRSVIWPGAPPGDAELDTARWRACVGFLWKVKALPAGTLVERGQFPPQGREQWYSGASDFFGYIPYRKQLLPPEANPFPFAVVAAVFALFLTLIGPVDFYALRWLRRPRATWLTFPLVCVGCTLLLVALANRQFGVSDHVGSLRILDVGHRGQVVRETRMEVLFPARAREQETRIVSGLATVFSEDIQGDRPTLRTEGSLTGAYVIRERVKQWQPRALVTRSFEPQPDDSGLAWATFAPDAASNTEEALRTTIAWFDPSGRFDVRTRGRGRFKSYPDGIDSLNLFGECPRRHMGFLSQLSPTPGNPLGDLAVMEPEDQRTLLVVAVRKDGPMQFTAYRRIFRW